MSQAFLERQLAAGGLVAPSAKCDAQLTEAIIARTYGSKILGDRVVVTLSSDRLVPAEDLAMEYLGLEGRELSPPVARQSRTALDFAHWALINQPKQARYALDLVKRMKSASRRATSKPGHAWDMYMEMADELNKSVRHFLPPFWEQVARAFKDIGNATYAGRAFNKALEAERVHALDVDRHHRRDAVLEFSLSGCLSSKALTEYSKDLSTQFDPQEAYDTYKDLVIRRTMGGMPPAATAATDLVRMAKAAKLDVDQEIASVLETIIASPSMSRAPLQFWKSVKKQVGQIVARNPSFAIWLLAHTDPQPRYIDDSLVWQWLDLLEGWNVLPWLSKPAGELPADVEIPGGRAGWISRLVSVETSPSKRVFELLEQMADVLREEGEPLSLTSSRGWRRTFDVDVLEACLQLGLEVNTPPPKAQLNFDGWLRATVDHPRRNSQLERVTQEPRFAPRVREQLPELIKFRGEDHVTRGSWGRKLAPRRSFEEAAAGHPAVREAWWQYLDAQLTALEQGGLVDFEEALQNLRGCAGAKTASEFPDFLPRLKAIDTAACLERTLVAGVFDEYGWETLDSVADEHPLPPASRRQGELLHWTFPHVAFLKEDRVHVVSPAGSAEPRELSLSTQQQLLTLLPVGDDLVVSYRDNGRSWKTFIRWMSQPKEEHEQPQSYYSFDIQALIPYRDSGCFYGKRTIQPGDPVLPEPGRHWYSDGSRFWRIKERFRYSWFNPELSDGETHAVVSEIDPATGEELRDSVPPFFETDLPAGSRVNWHLSYLLPLAESTTQAPLGSRDGLIGYRIVHRRDGAVETTGVDGRRIVFEAEAQPSDGFIAALGLMDKPASESSWIITNSGKLVDSETRIAFARTDEKSTKYHAGQPAELPKLFYHLMQVRSPESSQKLRATTVERARELLEAAAVEHQAKKEKADPDQPNPDREAARSAVRQWLDQAPPRLVAGVARIARIAAEEQASLENLLKRFEPKEDAPAADASAAVDTAVANRGLLQLDPRPFSGLQLYHFNSEQHDNAVHLQEVGRFFAGQPCDEKLACSLFWFELLRDPATVAWRCFWKTGTNESLGASVAERLNTPWLDALLLLAGTKLLDLPGSYKIYQTRLSSGENAKKGSFADRLQVGHPLAVIEGKRRYVAYRFSSYPDDRVFVLEYAADGKHQPPKKLTVDETVDVTQTWRSRDVQMFVKAVRQVQELPLPTAEELDAAAEELNVHPIAVALSYMGDLRTVLHGQEKLTKELRTHYGWKVKDIQLAISQLAGADCPESVGTIAVRGTPAGAIGEKRQLCFRRMVEAWKEGRKHVLPIPPELAKDLERYAGTYRRISSKKLAEFFSDPADSDLLRRRTAALQRPKQTRYRDSIEIVYAPPLSFDPEGFYPHLDSILGLLNYRTPIGDPLRRQIPCIVDAIRGFLDDRDTWLPFGGSTAQGEGSADTQAGEIVAKFAMQLGALEQDAEGLYRGGDELVAVALDPPEAGMMFRTSELKGPAELDRLRALAALTMRYDQPYGEQLPCADFVVWMRGAEVSELAEANRRTDLPEGRWEQDPRLSAPETVAKAAKTLAVSEPAAALYLQILSLPDPTERHVRLWNEWSAKQSKEAAAELVDGKHLVEAKRARAGRAIFLPGGWEPLAAPNLPIESWKLPLFGFESTDRLRGRWGELIVCTRSLRRLFEAAWQRVEEGDPPQYTAATIKRKRK